MLPSIRTLKFNIAITSLLLICYMLVERILKFGPEKIYSVLNMTKDSLTFLPLFPSRNLCFCRAPMLSSIRTAGPVSGHN